MIRCTLRSVNAAAAIATARKVLPVPAGPIPKVIVLRADRVDITFLVQRFGGDFGVAVAPDDVVEDRRRALFGVECAGHRFDGPGRDLVALLDQLDHLVDHGGRLLQVTRVAVEGEHVAAQVDFHRQAVAQPAQDRVLGAGELGGDARCRGSVAGGPKSQAPSLLRTAALTRLPSARPATFGITADITWPICFCSVAPVSSTAVGDQALELLVGELRRQVGLDQLRLGALGGGLLGPPGALVCLGRLDPFLAFPLQHRDLVAFAQLGVLLQRVDDQPQRRGLLAFARFHRRPHVALHLLENAHGIKVRRPRRA